MMKSVLSIIALSVIFSCSHSSSKESEFYVRGNCEMCKERIETTVKAITGVSNANWDLEKSSLKVVYDSTKVSEMDLQKSVAATGHGTKLIPMDAGAHAELPECCQVGNSH